MQAIALKKSLLLWIIGIIGVLSLLMTPLPLTIFPKEIQHKIDPSTFQYLMLINPIILITFATIIGHFSAKKLGLKTPILDNLFQHERLSIATVSDILKYALAGGVIAGIIIVLLSVLCLPLLPKELSDLEKQFQPHFLTRFLYGGITEEIIVRWGILSLIMLLFKSIFKHISPLFWWISIVISSILFGLGHLPITFMLVKNVTPFLIFFIVLSNSIFGVISGWLFWKKGLEASMIAHIIAHCILIFV
jgi:membrane protease YdiL (CAAX protease family)